MSATPSPAASPPRNLPFITFQGSKETYLSLHNRMSRKKKTAAEARPVLTTLASSHDASC